MFFYESTSLDPCFNLALEEHIFQTLDEDHEFLMLWQNSNSIIVGKFQNTAEEINQSYVDENNIKVVRRLSGGGAVYHDVGNLNYTLITGRSGADDFNFQRFAQPVIHVLAGFGIHAEFNGRNDLLIDGKKFSGCSQFSSNDRLLYHGCILLSSNLDVLSNALKTRTAKFQSKGVHSVSSRVTTINDHTKQPISMDDFKNALAFEILSRREVTPYLLTKCDYDAILNLQETKYATWEWNYGYYADYAMSIEHRFASGTLEVKMSVHDGRISGIRFFGDFFGNGDIHDLEQKLIGVPLNSDIGLVLQKYDVPFYINGVMANDLQNLLLYS